MHLNKLFNSSFSYLFFAVLSGFSVFYFLYFFNAYGIQKGLSYSGHSYLFRSISFGVLTFAYVAIFEGFIKPLWVNRKLSYLIVWYIALCLIGSQFIFLLFNFFWNWQEWDLKAYALILMEFPLMMLLPILFYQSLKSMSKTTDTIQEYLLFQSQNGKDQLKIKLEDFKYASSSENYITIFYARNNECKEHLIRKPLKTLEEELDRYTTIDRTHRSYLVNKVNIQAVKQQKGKVFLDIAGTKVPVSKKYQKHFLD